MILLALSGGIDSSGALFKLLAERHRVHTCHVVYKTDLERWPFEKKAAREIAQAARDEYGSDRVTISEHTVDIRGLRSCGHEELMTWSLIGAMVAKCDRRITATARGQNYALDPHSPERNAVRQLMFATALGRAIPEVLPVDGLTKQQTVDLIPPRLHRHLWVCRTPQGGFPCGHCRGCHAIAELQI